MINTQNISNLLQHGINPNQCNNSAYHRLIIVIDGNMANLSVQEMRGEEVYYTQHEQRVGDQTFVQTVRELGTAYRIHEENYVVNIKSSEDS